MEQFEIVDKGNHKMLYCHKEKACNSGYGTI